MEAQNPFVTVRPLTIAADRDIAARAFRDYDLGAWRTDNFGAPAYLAEPHCVRCRLAADFRALSLNGKGSSASLTFKGVAACYQCSLPPGPADILAPSCAQAGVYRPLPGL